MAGQEIDKFEFLDMLATKFNKFLFDNFNSSENLNIAAVGTGEVTPALFDLDLRTGYLANSSALAYYSTPWFNPVYATLIIRAYLGSMADCFAFFGFKEGSNPPTFDMTESHAGIMLSGGKMYFSTARTTDELTGQQRVEITGFDMTRDFIYKIEFNKLSTQPLPQVIPYFDGFRIITPDRIWTLKQTNSTYPPWDEVHYLMFYIKNTTGADKFLKIKALTYGEEYAD